MGGCRTRIGRLILEEDPQPCAGGFFMLVILISSSTFGQSLYMKFILSPSKRQELNTVEFEMSTPMFREEAERIAGLIQKTSLKQLKVKLKLSDNLGAVVYERWQDWKLDGAGTGPAVSVFQGDVYDGLDYSSLSATLQTKARESAIIVSALYGALRGGDSIAPYRLDLNDPFKISGKSLQTFWKSRIQEFYSSNERYVDLTSTEYKPLIPQGENVLRIDFKEEKDGKLKTVSFFAKKARGQFARWMLEQNIHSFDQLVQFDVDGYRFNAEASNARMYLFSR